MKLRFEESSSGRCVPSPPWDRSTITPNLGYFDLKRTPELIDAIPELQNLSELTALVRELNHHRSIVRSLACGHCLGTHTDPIFNRKFTSFVRLCFELLNWNGKSNYRSLYDNFEHFIGGSSNPVSDLATVEFVVDSAYYDYEGYQGPSLIIWNAGFGRSNPQARENWAVGISPVMQFFAQQRDEFQRELDGTNPAVS